MTDPIVVSPTAVEPAASAPATVVVLPDIVGERGEEEPGFVELNADGTPKSKGAEPSEAEKRIQQLVAQRKEAEEKARQAEAEKEYYRGLAEGKSPQGANVVGDNQPVPQQEQVTSNVPPVEPNPDDFEDYSSYEKAERAYIIAQAKWETIQEYNMERAKAKQAQARQTWMDKVKEASAKHPDFIQVLNNPAFIQSQAVALSVMDSDIGPELAYYLGKNLAETARLNSLPPHLAAKEIGRIEDRLKASAPSPVVRNIISQAPEPITPVVPVGATEVEEQDLPMEDFISRRNQKERERKRGLAS